MVKTPQDLATNNGRDSSKSTQHPGATKQSHPLVELTLTRVREFLREPEALFWVFAFPVLLSCALGLAFRNTGPDKLRVAVESSSDETIQSSASVITTVLARSADIEPVVSTAEDAAQALRSGKVALIVRPRNNRESPSSRENPSGTSNPTETKTAYFSFDYRYDPTRPESRMARLAVDDALQRAQGRSDRVVARDEQVTEPGARYIDFLIPGLIGLNLMGSGMWGLGFVIVTARGRKLLKRFAATPMRRSHYLLSFIFSRLIFLAVEVAAVLAFAWLAFGVVVRGSLVALAVVSLIGGLTFSGLGLLVAARPRTVEGVSGLMNLVMLPMWLLSGTFFSSARFPTPLQPFIKALPLTALNDSMRAVMNDGVSLASNWSQVGVMLAWGLLSFAIALRIFRWQ
ncbi:MAG: ABC transporter permease [Pyrinomonadaceae bacterium]